MKQYDLQKRISELKGSLGLVESELSDHRNVAGTMEDFKVVVDRARKSVWAVLTASASGDYNAFIADFRLRRAADLFREVHVDLDAGAVNAATPGLHELETQLADLVASLPAPAESDMVPFQTRTSQASPVPPKGNPDLAGRVRLLREQLEMIEGAIKVEEMAQESLEDLKAAVDNVRTGVLTILTASHSDRYPEMLGCFRVRRAAQIALNVHSDIALGVVTPESTHLGEFAQVSATLLERVEVLCGGALRRLSQELPALQS